MLITRSAHGGPWHLLLAAFFVIALAVPGLAQEAQGVTTIYLVRHADKLDDSFDSELSPRGHERADELSHVLQSVGLTAIFHSEFKRSLHTAEPTAAATQVSLTPYEKDQVNELADAIRALEAGSRILVVAHSETVDKVAAALGVEEPLPETNGKYDRLFIIHLSDTGAHFHTLRYGRLAG